MRPSFLCVLRKFCLFLRGKDKIKTKAIAGIIVNKIIKLIEDMPKHKLSENFEFLLDSGAKEIFDDPEMVVTAEEFLDNNLNSSETARKLFLHRNTLTYRLDKIERLTGLDIRKFSDAITFRLISIINRLTR